MPDGSEEEEEGEEVIGEGKQKRFVTESHGHKRKWVVAKPPTPTYPRVPQTIVSQM